MLDASALATEAAQGALPETLMSDADGKLLKEGLRSLERRIQPAPGPTIPDSVWDRANSLDKSYYSAIADKVRGGTFPKDVLSALVINSDHGSDHALRTDNCCHEQMMLTVGLGEYIYRTHTEKEILGHLQSFAGDDTATDEEDWEGATLAERLSALVLTIITEKMDEKLRICRLKVMVDSMNHLEIGRLRSAASEVELDTSGGKPALLLRLVEFMYSDVLLPPGPEDATHSLAGMAEETLARSLNKENVKKYLQIAQTLGRPKLKSACLAIVRENCDEILADNAELVSMIKEEKDEVWDMFIGGAADKGKKRKRGSPSNENDSTDSSGG